MDRPELIKRLKKLDKKSGKLEPSPAQRMELVNRVRDFAGIFIDNMHMSKTFITKEPKPEMLKLSGSTKSLDDILNVFADQVMENGINAASSGHLGYIPGGGIFASSLGDFLAAVTNEYAGIYYASPGATIIEQELLSWMKSLFGFPQSATGNLCSGGSIANLIALTAARDRHKIKGEVIAKSVVYLSEHVHHCVQKALRIIGLEDVIIRYIDLDERHRMRADILHQVIDEDKRSGLKPFMVIASAGTTDTGAMDPLDKIGHISRDNGLWYHIDGAYGGFFILTDEKREMFNGIEMADSLCIDPHKSMFIPYGLGAVIIKDREAVYHSNHYRANYMRDADLTDIPDNAADVSPELTKHFRGLRMWLPMQLYGVETFTACLEEKLLLINYMREEVKKIGFMVGPEPDLSVSYFWYPVHDGDENDFNIRLLEALHKDGRVYFSSTTINGRFVIRMAILSFRTKLKDIDQALEVIKGAMEAISRSRDTN